LKKECALCNRKETLKMSHIVPKMFVSYVKRNSLTNLLRDADNSNTPRQDGIKKEMLCGKCEEKFSSYETYFSNNYFSKVKVELNEVEKTKKANYTINTNKTFYNEMLEIYSKKPLLEKEISSKELYNFVLSIFWRYFKYLTEDELYIGLYSEEKEKLNKFINLAEEHFNNKEKFEELSEYKLHIFENKHLKNKIFKELKFSGYIPLLIHFLYETTNGTFRSLYPYEDKEYNYLRYIIIIPYFTLMLEIIPNEENIKFVGTELKIGNEIFGSNIFLDDELIINIFQKGGEKLVQGKEKMSHIQQEKIIKKIKEKHLV